MSSPIEDREIARAILDAEQQFDSAEVAFAQAHLRFEAVRARARTSLEPADSLDIAEAELGRAHETRRLAREKRDRVWYEVWPGLGDDLLGFARNRLGNICAVGGIEPQDLVQDFYCDKVRPSAHQLFAAVRNGDVPLLSGNRSHPGE